MMKRILSLIMDVLLLGVLTFTVSCSNDDDNVQPEPAPDGPATEQTTYTVMLYGCGGAYLDEYLDYNLNQIEVYGKHSRVNFTGLVKYSASCQSDPDKTGTRLYTLTDEGLKNEKKHEASYRLDNPEHLSDFIKEAKEKMPADKYILIVRSYGQEFGYNDKPVQTSYPEGGSQSRVAAYDDNTSTALSVYELEKGIKDADVKFDLVYFDLRKFGMAETYYQLKDCASYIMASSHPTPYQGGNYARLMNDLQENDSLADAIKSYVPATVKNWDTAESGTADLECYDMKYMDEFAQQMTTATSELIKLRQKETDVPEGLDDFDERQQARTYWFGKTQSGTDHGAHIYLFQNLNVSTELCSTLTRLSSIYLNGRLSGAAALLRSTVDKMTVSCAASGLPSWMDRVSMGINWPTRSFINRLSDNYRKNLSYSSFYQATGWDKFLLDSDMPVISDVPSVCYSNYFHYYEGEMSQYGYAWDVSLSVDDSGVAADDVAYVHALVDNLNAWYGELLAQYAFPLRHSRGLAVDLHKAFTEEIEDELEECGVKKVSIHVALKEGESIDSNDADAGKYPVTVDREYEL